MLTANLLRMANSAQFGLSRQVVRWITPFLIGVAHPGTGAVHRHQGRSAGAGAGPHGVLKFNMACAGFAQWFAAAWH